MLDASDKTGLLAEESGRQAELDKTVEEMVHLQTQLTKVLRKNPWKLR